ncbi:DNA (cytosine-5-)-methyltransferase [Hafnia paralvei]|uniref:DNA (cytosine-5-)-methyltransferase n=1 Tax=Hafnia paralvei TaxID=546367 RepID=UPI00300D3B20
MKYGSVCSGIEAASQAWEPLGWKPAWFSEIEPFPSAVLAYHWPDVKNLGDMTKIAGAVQRGEVEAPDILVGGTPCQAFSVAGLRAGLDDARGQLTLSYVELADAIDSKRSEHGEKPAIIVWENVPGVLSSKDNAFGCFIAGLAGESCELQPAGRKWTNAGCVFGPQRTVAWRVLDAQFFGVAQRRRRVFVIASARTDIDPTEVLFEREGVRRDTPPSRETRASTASHLGTSTKVGSHWDSELNPHPTLNQSHNVGGIGSSNQEVFSQRGAGLVPDVVGALDTECGFSKATEQSLRNGHVLPVYAFRQTAFGEYADDETASTCCARDYKDATDLAISFNWQAGGNTSSTLGADEHCTGTLQASQSPAIAYSDVSRSLLGKSNDSMAEDLDTYAISTPAIGIAGNIIGRKPENGGNGKGYCFETGYTLTKSDQHGVMHDMQVRRLTPRECERLQGFPDDHTLVPYGRKIRPEKMDRDFAKYLMRGGNLTFEECCGRAADGPRYKAIGNSMAVPVMRWIGMRLNLFSQSSKYGLLPCPFCGEPAFFDSIFDYQMETRVYAPSCTECSCELMDGTINNKYGRGWYASKQDAAEAWNNRRSQ